LATFADRPSAANQVINVIRTLMRHALEAGLRTDDPTAGIRKLRSATGGFKSWTEENIAQFQRAHPVGTRARLALDLLLFTGQRRGDVVRMGRQHVRDGVLSIKQSKTGSLVEVPVHDDLRKSLDCLPNDSLTFLMTAQGKPFTAPGFTNHFRDLCAAAGLPVGLSPHGLRKAACRRLAEAGCSAPQIMAISGHKTLSEAQKYIETANRAHLAREGMSKVTRMMNAAEKRTKAVKPATKV
jgi:integrase